MHQADRTVDAVRIHYLVPGADSFLSIKGKDREAFSILVLSESDSLRLRKLDCWGSERLVLSSAALWLDEPFHLSSQNPDEMEFALFPETAHPPEIAGTPLKASTYGVFKKYVLEIVPHKIVIETQRMQSADVVSPNQIWPTGVAQAPSDETYAHADTRIVHVAGKGLKNCASYIIWRIMLEMQIDHLWDQR